MAAISQDQGPHFTNTQSNQDMKHIGLFRAKENKTELEAFDMWCFLENLLFYLE